MTRTMFTDRNGNEYLIEPLTQAHVLRTVKELKAQGIVVTTGDEEFEKGLTFQLGLAANCLAGLKLKDPTDGTFKELDGPQRKTYLAETPGATAWVSGKASKLAEEAAKLFEEEQGNS